VAQREAGGGDDAPLAARIGDTRKIVVSNQPLTFTWRNSEQLDVDLIDAVHALKATPGGDIAISGSISIVRQLLNAGSWTSCTCSSTRSRCERGCVSSTKAARPFRSAHRLHHLSPLESCTSSTAQSSRPKWGIGRLPKLWLKAVSRTDECGLFDVSDRLKRILRPI
jgi:hypothetical protein